MARHRVYDFELPRVSEGGELSLAIFYLKSHKDIWSRLPLDIRNRALNAQSTLGGKFVLEAKDLDRIDDDTLNKLSLVVDWPWHWEEDKPA